MTLTYLGQGVNSSVHLARRRATIELFRWLLSNPDLIPQGKEALNIVDQGLIFELTEHPGTFQIRLSEKTALLVVADRCYCDPERERPVCAHRIARRLVMRTLELSQRYERTTPPQMLGLAIKKGASLQ